ncbi:MAG: Arc family DNA-binding protein [Alphaproteobacteria bacterium]|nr:MAG: Arc family DNA-binding protein [Alphaproteobacteria bacterium]
MAQVLVRQLDEDVVARLKERAKSNGRSLEAEIRTILREATADPIEELQRIRESLLNRRFSDSSDIIRKR